MQFEILSGDNALYAQYFYDMIAPYLIDSIQIELLSSANVRHGSIWHMDNIWVRLCWNCLPK